MPCGARIGRGIGNAPENHLSHRIVGSAESPGGRLAARFGSASPTGVPNRIIGTGRSDEPPEVFSGLHVMRSDVALRAAAIAGAAGDDLVFEDNRSGRES